MIYVSVNNIYLCDLEFLGAEIAVLEERKRGKRVVRASFGGREAFDLMVKACPQGWHVKKGINVGLDELAGFVEERYDERENFPYYCFQKIRQGKMQVVGMLRFVLPALAAFWADRWVLTLAWQYPVMAALAILLFVVNLFLPREILKRTYEDFMKDAEEDQRNGFPGPMDFHDMFN